MISNKDQNLTSSQTHTTITPHQIYQNTTSFFELPIQAYNYNNHKKYKPPLFLYITISLNNNSFTLILFTMINLRKIFMIKLS